MSYEVLARKWRPQQFDDVVGQNHVIQTLRNAIASGRIAHAYLFVGSRGIGKTSIARLYAKALNCENGPTITPCGKCSSCIDIVRGTSLDVLEIDGASNNGVDQVRDLRDTVKYAPAKSKFKIYIIDEVHMLSTAAFNALLKTLEEPPAHVKFFFATTEPEKILPTIVSRCQRFDLRRIPVQLIMERLRLIVDDEGLDVEDDALLAVARSAEGGLRDAESALDQLISFKGNKITEDDVLSVFGLVSRTVLEGLAESILTGDIRQVISIVHQLDEAGRDLQRLVIEMLEMFRNILIYLTLQSGEGMDLTEAQVAGVARLAEITNTDRVLRITTLLSETEDRIRFALSRRTLLETALIRCSRAAVVVTLDEILGRLNALHAEAVGGRITDSGTLVQEASARPSGYNVIRKEPSEVSSDTSGGTEPVVRESSVRFSVPDREASPVKSDPEVPGHIEISPELHKLCKGWRDIVTKIGVLIPGADPLLYDAIPVSVIDDNVHVAFDPEFSGEADRVSGSKAKVRVAKILSRHLGRDVTVTIEVAAPGSEAAELFALHTGHLCGQLQQEEEVPSEVLTEDGDRSKSALLQDPLVLKTLNAFNGTLTEFRG